MKPNTNPRYTVVWDGYAEGYFKICDELTQTVVKIISPSLIGTTAARHTALLEAARLNHNTEGRI